MSDKKAWDPETMGFNKHDYHHIDPDTINVMDFAANLRGEEKNFGDVRQYNSAYNEKHPENNVDLDWLGRAGTVFSTEAEAFEGTWIVVNTPAVRAPHVYTRVKKYVEGVEAQDTPGDQVEISCTNLGCVADGDNLYPQVKTVLVKKGSVTRDQRKKLTQLNG